MQAGVDAVLAKPLSGPRRDRRRGLARFIVTHAPVEAGPMTLRWPGWTTMLIAVGGSGVCWLALIAGMTAIFHH